MAIASLAKIWGTIKIRDWNKGPYNRGGSVDRFLSPLCQRLSVSPYASDRCKLSRWDMEHISLR